MAVAEFEAALSAEGWSQPEMDTLRQMIVEVTRLRDIYRLANLEFSAALAKWNDSMSAKVATLPAAFGIPNPTDLAGTNDIVKESLQLNIMAYVTTAESLGSQAHLQNIMPLIGSVNAEV